MENFVFTFEFVLMDNLCFEKSYVVIRFHYQMQHQTLLEVSMVKQCSAMSKKDFTLIYTGRYSSYAMIILFN